MRKELVSCEEAREVSGVKLTPVVRSILTWADIGGTVSFYACRQPAYLLVERYPDVRVLRASGEEITLQQVYSECPGIREALVERFPGLPAQGN
ncbi:MAG: hypothetical protein JW901_01985 [Dehalococcoidia bacterium]|nr:hypothetical protein [Dehalococcoidia bacterium]